MTDIFGLTNASIALCNQISMNMQVVDPYQGELKAFENERAAYSYFMENVGINAYTEILGSYIKNIAKPVILIGFSVGATAIWNACNTKYIHLEHQENIRAFCFYGSQIRYTVASKPNVKLDLVLPKKEASFDINTFESHLRELYARDIENDLFSIIKTPYLHGFMNKHSTNFNLSAYNTFIEYLHRNIIT